jgi:hypothetical protein
MAPRARCWRVHSALTQKVNAIEAIHDRFHAACEGIQSGQLSVLGLKISNLLLQSVVGDSDRP